MINRSTRFLISFTVFTLAVFLAMPRSVFGATAKSYVKGRTIAYDLYNPRRTYGDEKAMIANPVSRCNTQAMQKIHLGHLVRAEKDLITMKVTTTTPAMAKLYDTYLDKVDLSWGAMEEPYCGFGAFGAKAAINSYYKSVTRARSEFLTLARKIETD